MSPLIILLLSALSSGPAPSSPDSLILPGPSASAPVVHAGRYHVLTCGRTSVVLDGLRGMSVVLVGDREEIEGTGGGPTARLGPGSLRAEVNDGGRTIRLDQADDPAARLKIVSQGPTHAAARVFFALRSADNRLYGSGTVDIIVYRNRVHFIPSLFLDDPGPGTTIGRGGFELGLPPGTGEIRVLGKTVPASSAAWFGGFGGTGSAFEAECLQAGGRVLKFGWLRNQYPPYLYLRETAGDPRTDELYERWPMWTTQRGAPLGWGADESSGLEVGFVKGKPAKLSLLWTRGRDVPVAAGGYAAFNAPLVVVLGKTADEARDLWEDYSRPLVPLAEAGEFRYYNEIEGLYEVDSGGGPLSLVFGAAGGKAVRSPLVRVWNLQGSGAQVFRADGAPVPVSLMNDDDLIDDPVVSIVKTATGPARSAIVALDLPAGRSVRLTGAPGPGLQLAYEMFSDLETFEAWSDRAEAAPLFRIHLKDLAVYQATFPGARDYAIFKLPLYFMKNGVNPSTFMSELRDLEIAANGPEEIRLSVRSVSPAGTGLSSYSLRVPNAPEALSFEITAEFVPLDDGRRWTSLEYCDLYPFEDVFRRNFHYRDVTWLTKDGVFDRIGTGSWAQRFETVAEPGRDGFSSRVTDRPGPGAKVPQSGEGQAWLLGNNAERGNVLFRRGRLDVSAGVRTSFSLCNAWVDVHNSLTGRTEPAAVERVSYAVDVFPGAVPGLDVLNRYLARDGGAGRPLSIKAARFSPRGEIVGFVTE